MVAFAPAMSRAAVDDSVEIEYHRDGNTLKPGYTRESGSSMGVAESAAARPLHAALAANRRASRMSSSCACRTRNEHARGLRSTEAVAKCIDGNELKRGHLLRVLLHFAPPSSPTLAIGSPRVCRGA